MAQGVAAPAGGNVSRLLTVGWLLLCAGCAPAHERAAVGPPSFDYFGQRPPGLVPEVFAPGVVSRDDRYEYVIAFSPDGNECCFGVTDSAWSTCTLYDARRVNGTWTTPAPAAFQGDGDGWLPSFSPDGRRLMFSSGRPDIMHGSNAYVCTKGADGWSAPVPLEAPVNSPGYDWRPLETRDGTLYFSSDRPAGLGQMDLYRAAPAEHGSRNVENLGAPFNTASIDASPCLSPDGRVMTLESWRAGGYGKGDLYVCFRQPDGTWSEPKNLGPAFNTEAIEDGGSFSPDGRYFFFNRRADWETDEQTDLYWVDARALFAPGDVP